MGQRKTKIFTVNGKLINTCTEGKLLGLRLHYNGIIELAINLKKKLMSLCHN